MAVTEWTNGALPPPVLRTLGGNRGRDGNSFTRLIVRGQKVMLDSDLAVLYGVTTAGLNQQVRRNPDRFPSDFAFQLTRQEFTSLISQNVISSSGHGGRRTTPRALTKQGVAMLSSVLKSPRAVRVNVEIMRAFVRLRQTLALNSELACRLDDLEKRVAKHDKDFLTVIQAIRELMKPPATPQKPPIGFHAANDSQPPGPKAGKRKGR